MKLKLQILSLFLLFSFGFLFAQEMERSNLIWARTTSETITLDGVLSESAWQDAESFHMTYGENTQFIPGSGYRQEQGVAPSDPTDVTFKLLVNGNNLYLAATVMDSSVGGGLFNKFDGFLINIRNRAEQVTGGIAPPFEYFYGWVTEGWADPATGEVGASPGFFGWAAGSRDSIDSRTGLTNGEVWNAVTVVNGTSNDDSTPDEGYTVEFMFNLAARGYDVTKTEGDIVEFNISVYDADWQWPLNADKFSGNRAWWAGPWGNASSYDIVRIYARPDVTTSSGAVPEVGPELVFENGANFDDPVIDGKLDEDVWGKVKGFDIRYGDEELRSSYPGIGPWRSGQFQPEINGVKAAVVDPGDATIKAFFKGNMLYLGVDARDQAVWGNSQFDLWDGIRFVINDRAVQNADNVLEPRVISAVVDSLGQLMTADYLTTMIDSGSAQAALALNSGTTVNDFNDVDNGYSIEIAIDLTGLGYPADRGDGVLFFSATLFDGEKFDNAADNYGTRTWFFRESGSPAAPAWTFMDATKMVGGETAISDEVSAIPSKFELLGNYPNPFNPSTRIKFTLAESGTVKLNVFNVKGQKLAESVLGKYSAGTNEVQYTANHLSTGLYFYNLEFTHAGKRQVTKTQKMLLIK
ncbi:MAG: T9SS type A sorting domain-containing protein [Calditrichaeota bacterium]|nr:T9SS type A sorting domain-containing protein [Calditrichota bacterium]